MLAFLRSVPLIAVFSFVLMGEGSVARADSRKVFETRGGVFVHISGDRWIEKRDGDVDSHFTELARTPAYVEIYDRSRKLSVRLYHNQGKWLDRSTGEWVPWPGSNGRWR